MYHLDRRKTVRGQTVVALLAVLLFAVAGGGVGFWLGRYATIPALTSDLAVGFRTLPTTPNQDRANDDTDAPDVDAITSSLGNMQAELMRLDALGERLVEMAGLSAEEFDFQNPPPQGGPEEGLARDYTIKEIASELGSVVGLLKDRKRKLEILEEAIMERDITAKSVPSGWPVRAGYITSNYGFRIHPIKGRRLFHQGVDFAAPSGSPVVAVADGLVTFSGRRSGYGNMIELRHVDGYATRYAHNQANLVQEGQQVRQGQKIGAVGATGTATGPHVHFEVLKNGEHLNPIQFVGRQSPSVLVAANPDNPS
ncbi:MAG: M23 family metallopeptidase [Lamprocystis purpurea]|jgi:murein DD-endopeptidase MepM/ murein hydrolase activator NlpD|uniref:M23 family metallopeptidase n=1 Tax=Lamprocystis purpurea TaxID=61598 RepID=UPI00037F0EA3|nr:M23 family metallopeptidase [Lamprocystis purpurea]MBV5272298.1 M23 family metallopeptidase [Lamprocystis purpurea]